MDAVQNLASRCLAIESDQVPGHHIQEDGRPCLHLRRHEYPLLHLPAQYLGWYVHHFRSVQDHDNSLVFHRHPGTPIFLGEVAGAGIPHARRPALLGTHLGQSVQPSGCRRRESIHRNCGGAHRGISQRIRIHLLREGHQIGSAPTEHLGTQLPTRAGQLPHLHLLHRWRDGRRGRNLRRLVLLRGAAHAAGCRGWIAGGLVHQIRRQHLEDFGNDGFHYPVVPPGSLAAGWTVDADHGHRRNAGHHFHLQLHLRFHARAEDPARARACNLHGETGKERQQQHANEDVDEQQLKLVTARHG
mmetsp:Transcript_570/g.1616  ORF Transcript_570/g.1616 Transcript_570/m.1616 type:complete len:301 (+) Transcript_570:600-1502(+)